MGILSEIFGYPLGWIMWLLYKVFLNYGIALILFTFIVKILLFPLSVKQQKSSVKMALFKPKMDEIQKKYAKDPKKQQEAMQELYTKEGYSPFSGCLPLLIQFPILFGVIDVVYKPLTYLVRLDKATITAATEILNKFPELVNRYSPQIGVISAVKNPETVGNFSELGADVIEKIGSVDLNFLGLNLGDVPGWTFPLILIPILSALTSLGVSLYSMKKSSAGGEQQANGVGKATLFIMPLFSLFFATKVPVGVGIYWIVSNILSFVQTVILNKKYNIKEIMEKMKLEEEEKKRQQKELKAQLHKKIAEGETVTEKEREKTYTAKEINRAKLAEARKRDAEKYGEEYVEVTDEDLI